FRRSSPNRAPHRTRGSVRIGPLFGDSTARRECHTARNLGAGGNGNGDRFRAAGQGTPSDSRPGRWCGTAPGVGNGNVARFGAVGDTVADRSAAPERRQPLRGETPRRRRYGGRDSVAAASSPGGTGRSCHVSTCASWLSTTSFQRGKDSSTC